MNAIEAKIITAKAQKAVGIIKFLEHIDTKIDQQAKNGQSKIVVDYGGTNPNEEQRRAIRLNYENNGFFWLVHTTPPSNDPREHDWEEITW